jgi:hypothetical protein
VLKKAPPILLVLVLIALGLAAASYARPLTTGPEHVDNVKVTMRDSGISLSKATFLRGGNARFIAINKGSKPYKFKIGVVSTKLLKPGQTGIVLAELDFRGKFPLQQLNAAGKQIDSIDIKIT